MRAKREQPRCPDVCCLNKSRAPPLSIATSLLVSLATATSFATELGIAPLSAEAILFHHTLFLTGTATAIDTLGALNWLHATGF